MSKHTKGEWNTGLGVMESIVKNEKYIPIMHSHKRVATIHILQESNGVIDINQKEGEANAKLIAAAPDLLYALKKCQNILSNMDDDPNYCSSNDYCNAVDFTKQAIEKTK